jgi:hypothetical protein
VTVGGGGLSRTWNTPAAAASEPSPAFIALADGTGQRRAGETPIAAREPYPAAIADNTLRPTTASGRLLRLLGPAVEVGSYGPPRARTTSSASLKGAREARLG